MSLIILSSPKGGVGVTTLAAHLAAHYARHCETFLLGLGHGRDFELHFRNLFERDPAPDAQQDDENPWKNAHSAGGLHVLSKPFTAGVLTDALVGPAHRGEGVVIVDAPSMPLEVAQRFAEGGHLVCVLGADAVSLDAALRVTHVHPANDGPSSFGDTSFVLNKIDPRRQLCRDVEAIAQEGFKQGLVGRIRFDAHVPDAVAQGLLVDDFAASAQAVRDIADLAERLRRQLGLERLDRVRAELKAG